MIPQTILVDARSVGQHFDNLCVAIAAANFIGIDCETEDDRRHDGLNCRCGYDPKTRKKSPGKPLVFDHRRTTLCGVSFYSENMNGAYYLNIGHADVENRLSHDVLRQILDCKRPEAYWIAHNSPFEITTFHNTLGYALDPNIICTLQMAVSAYGPHEFDHDEWVRVGAGGIAKLVPALVEQSIIGLEDSQSMTMSPALSDLVYKIIAKESSADHSYNGLVKSIAYGYSLKRMVETHFGYKMETFAECLGDAAHMGQLTGEQVVSYGADDAYWAIRVFRHLMSYMLANGGPELIQTFFEQENPMAVVFSEIARGGLRVNTDAITARRRAERDGMAETLRRMKPAVAALLPFPAKPSEGLWRYDKWYQSNWEKYRGQVSDWALSSDCEDPLAQCRQVRGPVSNSWSLEEGLPAPIGINLSHYMPVRTILYDLIDTKPLVSQGKIESDGEARGKLRDRLEKEGNTAAVEVIDCLTEIAGVEQRMKLYLTPYSQLMDPETGCLYPTVTSMLATRRMASSEPNGMQLAKRGESTYVRGFFKADYDDHVILSCDWSAIELVEIAEFSGDPKMCEAFATLPHDDLHSGAAADILAVDCPGLNEDAFKALKKTPDWAAYVSAYGSQIDNLPRLQMNLKGEAFAEPKAANKYWRTEIGKGANFNYWYSGWLATIGERMGWSPEKTKLATERYANRFAVAEQWRLNKIAEVARNGFITLPDHHRYVRYEATSEWAIEWCAKFLPDHLQAGLENYANVINFMARKLQRRAGNQTVNAEIQGSCATIAKRSRLRIGQKARDFGWGDREFRFMLPNHDELIFSVHRDIVPEAIQLVRGTMIDHPDLFKKCKLDSSPAIGLTFEPWHAKKAPIGQIELYEPPAEVVGAALADKRLDDDGVRLVVDWLFTERNR